MRGRARPCGQVGAVIDMLQAWQSKGPRAGPMPRDPEVGSSMLRPMREPGHPPRVTSPTASGLAAAAPSACTVGPAKDRRSPTPVGPSPPTAEPAQVRRDPAGLPRPASPVPTGAGLFC
ncbi:hypothetical protein MANAM107_16480 [Actinomyces capricornis]|uniref:Uncharacterized protein n=1 Tax=Actinomyces capricornis TaxID=2755559 RepID=A0ABM7UBY7_9ACTO|nr:hypothetical protein MANAM107_16480 [Actinomyces capricornis]